MRLIDANALYEEVRDIAKQYERYNSKTCTFKDCIEFFENLIYVTPTIDVVPMDFFEKCLDEEIKKRIQTERTNRQILENYVPVVHAKWIMDDIGIHRCSNCSERLPFIHCYSEEKRDEWDDEWDEEIEETLYCPRCGAKMDGGKDDENA